MALLSLTGTANAAAGSAAGVVDRALDAGKGVSTRSIDGQPGFLQIRYDGSLWFYEHTESGFVGHPLGGGWESTSQVALISGGGGFLEVKNGVLRIWLIDVQNGYSLHFGGDIMGGWDNAKLIAGVGEVNGDNLVDFVEVTTGGQLELWLGDETAGFKHGRTLGYGWQNAKQIAGTNDYAQFVETDAQGQLSIWGIPPEGYVQGGVLMGGWDNVRLLGPGGVADSFVSVRHDGTLVQWKWVENDNYHPGIQDGGWGNTRLLG
ncbi:hypothetical protein [Amycolatopsis anabasis]|uniref:hypothetical protein n=1 Tax=Amycolatopsis anabasis TaxID=1840409 RepID=UPI00131A814F|nr:hypothetical protein [Amycolatopsis anabasis]